ncbi:hypothetical protein HYS50_01990 [Candidatus Woesearchaeota archaeon]|nr:hypothetical protein [Candidatus Woesearchaeota archaeon]
MVKRQSYTYQRYWDDKRFLEATRGFPIDTTPDGYLEAKRHILEERYGPHSKIKPRTARRKQIHTAFQRIHQEAAFRVQQIESSSLYQLMLQEQLQPQEDEGLAERIAIMLDSCTDEQLEGLTEFFGKTALEEYARSVNSKGIF